MPRKKDEPQLFLCHSSKDKSFVRRLANELSQLSVHVWLDEWELQPGDSLHGVIGAALEKTAFVGVVISPNSIKSKWVQRELQAALAREVNQGKTFVIPLLYKSVTLPTFLADKLYLDFRTSRTSQLISLAQLAASIHKLSPRDIALGLSERKPKTLNDIKLVLRNAGWSEWTYVDRGDYETIRRALKRAGVNIESDEFDVVTRSKAGKPRRRIPLKK